MNERHQDRKQDKHIRERKKRFKKDRKKDIRESELTYTLEELFEKRKGYINYKRLKENFRRRG